MKRFWLWMPLLAGCAAPLTKPAPVADQIDYKAWPQLSTKPIPVAVAGWRYCEAPSPDSEYAKASERLGPHLSPAIRIFANAAAAAHLKAGNAGSLPAGAVIVKEKLLDVKGEGLVAYAAMIKREAGYDSVNGDWEYLYARLVEGGRVERGRLASCIDCHKRQAANDYLFRAWEKVAKE